MTRLSTLLLLVVISSTALAIPPTSPTTSPSSSKNTPPRRRSSLLPASVVDPQTTERIPEPITSPLSPPNAHYLTLFSVQGLHSEITVKKKFDTFVDLFCKSPVSAGDMQTRCSHSKTQRCEPKSPIAPLIHDAITTFLQFACLPYATISHSDDQLKNETEWRFTRVDAMHNAISYLRVSFLRGSLFDPPIPILPTVDGNPRSDFLNLAFDTNDAYIHLRPLVRHCMHDSHPSNKKIIPFPHRGAYLIIHDAINKIFTGLAKDDLGLHDFTLVAPLSRDYDYGINPNGPDPKSYVADPKSRKQVGELFGLTKETIDDVCAAGVLLPTCIDNFLEHVSSLLTDRVEALNKYLTSIHESLHRHNKHGDPSHFVSSLTNLEFMFKDTLKNHIAIGRDFILNGTQSLRSVALRGKAIKPIEQPYLFKHIRHLFMALLIGANDLGPFIHRVDRHLKSLVGQYILAAPTLDQSSPFLCKHFALFHSAISTLKKSLRSFDGVFILDTLRKKDLIEMLPPPTANRIHTLSTLPNDHLEAYYIVLHAQYFVEKATITRLSPSDRWAVIHCLSRLTSLRCPFIDDQKSRIQDALISTLQRRPAKSPPSRKPLVGIDELSSILKEHLADKDIQMLRDIYDLQY